MPPRTSFAARPRAARGFTAVGGTFFATGRLACPTLGRDEFRPKTADFRHSSTSRGDRATSLSEAACKKGLASASILTS